MNHIPITNRNVRQYIDKFMDGATSNAEEQALYAYFRTHEVPQELQPYREMFAYYEAGMPDELLPDPVPLPEARPRRRKLWRLASMVAAACLLTWIGFAGKRYYDWQEFVHTYEGSYMIVKGKRVEDLRQLKPQILSSLSEARQMEKQSVRLLSQQPPQADEVSKEILQEANEPEMRRQLEAILY